MAVLYTAVLDGRYHARAQHTPTPVTRSPTFLTPLSQRKSRRQEETACAHPHNG